MAAVRRTIKPRRTHVHVRHAQRHGEVRASEFDIARTILPRPLRQSWPGDAVQRLAHWDESALLGGVLQDPCLTAIAAACQQVFFWAIVINRMATRAVVLEVTRTEPH